MHSYLHKNFILAKSGCYTRAPSPACAFRRGPTPSTEAPPPTAIRRGCRSVGRTSSVIVAARPGLRRHAWLGLLNAANPGCLDTAAPGQRLPVRLQPPFPSATAVRASSGHRSSGRSAPLVRRSSSRVRCKFPMRRQYLCSGGQSWLSTNELILAITKRNNYGQCLCDYI
jgi:hypothetical protein